MVWGRVGSSIRGQGYAAALVGHLSDGGGQVEAGGVIQHGVDPCHRAVEHRVQPGKLAARDIVLQPAALERRARPALEVGGGRDRRQDPDELQAASGSAC